MKIKKQIVYFKNDVYLNKSRYNNPKENFKFLIKLLKAEKLNNKFSLLDVGCSNGELLYNLNNFFKKASLTGIDVDGKLLNKAKKICPKNIVFLKKNISNTNLKIGKFDVIILSGVLSIFKNSEKILRNLLSLLKSRGKIFIFDSLNVYSYNLYIKSETFEQNKKRVLYKNMYSTAFLKKFFKKCGKKTKFIPFVLKTNIKKDKKNPINGWTENLSGKKIVTSGLGLIQRQFWIKVFD